MAFINVIHYNKPYIYLQEVAMANELVKYEPELNTIPLRKFTPVEMNLFFQSSLECVKREIKKYYLLLIN